MRGKRIINTTKSRRLRKKKNFEMNAALSFNTWIEKMNDCEEPKSDDLPSDIKDKQGL